MNALALAIMSDSLESMRIRLATYLNGVDTDTMASGVFHHLSMAKNSIENALTEIECAREKWKE